MMNGARTSSYIKGMVHPKIKIYHNVETNFISPFLWNTKKDILKTVSAVLVHTMKVNWVQINIRPH